MDRAMTERPSRAGGDLTRRRFLQGAALAGTAAYLAACSPARPTGPPTVRASAGASAGTPAPPPSPSAGIAASAVPPTGPLRFANREAYIDIDQDGASPTLVEFEAAHGVAVEYANAAIVDDESFFASIRTALEDGGPTGWDLIVVSDWLAARLVLAGWAEEIAPGNVRTALTNVRDELRGLPWDPQMRFHYPWQSVATGLGYNRASTGRDLTGVADLFDPALAGKVTLLRDPRATLPLVHLALQAQGKASDRPPAAMTVQDAQAAIDYLRPFVESGHVRAFTGNEYLTDLGSGDTWAALVLSGDFASSASPDDVFVYPEEGWLLTSHSLVIPSGAEHKHAAELMIDWVYDVDHAARLADWTYHISPVKGVAEVIAAFDPRAAANPLLFPPPDVLGRQHAAPAFSESDETTVQASFAVLAG
jgi:spermidine/putrescine transport system substrate-binding protein